MISIFVGFDPKTFDRIPRVHIGIAVDQAQRFRHAFDFHPPGDPDRLIKALGRVGLV